MPATSVSVEISATPERVWQLIGGFSSLPEWLPPMVGSTLSEGGRVRSLTTADGSVMEERLESFDQSQRTYTYSFITSPFPVTDYRSTLRVHDIPGRPQAARVEWSGTFTPVGVSDDEAVALFRNIYSEGLAAVEKAFAA